MKDHHKKHMIQPRYFMRSIFLTSSSYGREGECGEADKRTNALHRCVSNSGIWCILSSSFDGTPHELHIGSFCLQQLAIDGCAAESG